MEKHATLLDIITKSPEMAQYTLLGDTNHRKSVEKFGWLADNMEALAAAGYENIAIEQGNWAQPSIDLYLAGEIDSFSQMNRHAIAQKQQNGKAAETYPTHVEDEADKKTERSGVEKFFAQAREHNIRIVAIDEAPPIASDPEAIPYIQKEKGVARYPAQNNPFRLDLLVKDLFNEDIQKADETWEKLSYQRHHGDQPIVDHLKRETGDQQTLVVFGDGHFKNTHGIDEYLGEKNTFHISLAMDNKTEKNSANAEDQPDIIYAWHTQKATALNPVGESVMENSIESIRKIKNGLTYLEDKTIAEIGRDLLTAIGNSGITESTNVLAPQGNMPTTPETTEIGR